MKGTDMNLLKCDKCGNRNVMCSLCEKNRLYRETEYSHDNFIRNKAVDEFAEELLKVSEGNIDMYVWCSDIKRIAEQMKAGGK